MTLLTDRTTFHSINAFLTYGSLGVIYDFVPDRRCACVCKMWSEAMQEKFLSTASNHLHSGRLIIAFMRSALSPRLSLDGLQNRDVTAILVTAATLIFRTLRAEFRPASINQIMFLRTQHIEKLLQDSKDQNLVSFVNNMSPVARVADPREARDWIRDNSDSLALRTYMSNSETALTEIPDEINSLTGLTYLDFTPVKDRISLPKNCNFPNLITLFLRGLIGLPCSFTAPKLQQLHLFGKRERGMQRPAIPFDLNFPNLRILSLGNMSLPAFPDGTDFSNLEDLELSSVQNASDFLNMLVAPRLEGLTLRGTRFNTCPNLLKYPALQRVHFRSDFEHGDAEIAAFPNGMIPISPSVALYLSDSQRATWAPRMSWFEFQGLRFRINCSMIVSNAESKASDLVDSITRSWPTNQPNQPRMFPLPHAVFRFQ